MYLASIFCAFHVTKNTRLSTTAQLQCLRSRAWEPGNEAKNNVQREPEQASFPGHIPFSSQQSDYKFATDLFLRMLSIVGVSTIEAQKKCNYSSF